MHELLSDASRWTKGADARDVNGHIVGATSAMACQWCLFGAAVKCYPVIYPTILSRISDTTKRMGPITWNDAPGRTFKEVKAVLLKLDI